MERRVRLLVLWAVCTAVVGVGVAVADREPSSPELAVASSDDVDRSSTTTSTTARPTTTTTTETTVPSTTVTTATAATAATAPRPTPTRPEAEAPTTTHPPTPAAPALADCPQPQPTAAPPFTFEHPILIPMPYGASIKAWIGQNMGGCWIVQGQAFPGDNGDYWRTLFQWPPSFRFDYRVTAEAWNVDVWWDGTTIASNIVPVPYQPIVATPGTGIPGPTELGNHLLPFGLGGVHVVVEADRITITGGGLPDGWSFVRVGAPVPSPNPTIDIVHQTTGERHTVTVGRNRLGEVYATMS